MQNGNLDTFDWVMTGGLVLAPSLLLADILGTPVISPTPPRLSKKPMLGGKSNA